MDDTIAIKVTQVSKKYAIGKQKDGSLRGSLASLFQPNSSNEEEFWALNDVNFEIKKGDVVGIIGKNGAGKSTLLKILSQITSPTTGRIEIDGRVASLLEVGTGFHPELTGRENIFLNGTILGMSRKEVKDKFDEIVTFSGIEKFIDTPVKHYSSGMYVRLAFAVAAHLEPEILIIDEVLAVGDADFQKKCLGKMKDVAGQGRTVIFVSHSMAAVKTLCPKTIFLKKGTVEFVGSTDEAIFHYIGNKNIDKSDYVKSNLDFEVNEVFTLNQISMKALDKDLGDIITEDDTFELITDIDFHGEDAQRYHLTYHLINENGEALFSTSTNKGNILSKKGKNLFICEFPSQFLQAGNYSLNIYITEDKKRAIKTENYIFSFSISERNRELGVYMGKEPGYIRPNLIWKTLEV